MTTTITLGRNDETRRLAALRRLVEEIPTIGRNGDASLSELMSRLADAAEDDPAGVAADMRAILERPRLTPDQRIPQVERAVIALLKNQYDGQAAYLWHPALRAWIEALGTAPDESRPLSHFVRDSAELRATLAAGGYSDDPGRDLPAYTNRFHGDRATARAVQLEDGAAHRLAVKLTLYRRARRPPHDMTLPPLIPGGDDELGMSMITSLAAAIGEYQVELTAAYEYSLRLERERNHEQHARHRSC